MWGLHYSVRTIQIIWLLLRPLAFPIIQLHAQGYLQDLWMTWDWPSIVVNALNLSLGLFFNSQNQGPWKMRFYTKRFRLILIHNSHIDKSSLSLIMIRPFGCPGDVSGTTAALQPGISRYSPSDQKTQTKMSGNRAADHPALWLSGQRRAAVKSWALSL